MDSAQRMTLALLAMLCIAGALVGCNSGDRNVAPPQSQGGQTDPHADAGSMGMGQTAPDVKPLKDAQKTYDAAKKQYEGSKNDAAAKKDYLTATMGLANAYMFGEDSDRKVKYKMALQYYREALKVDPKNEEAQKDAELIVSIYKQMGRPVPGGS